MIEMNMSNAVNMSDVSISFLIEDQLRDDAENNARMQGVVAVLALPKVRTTTGEWRARLVEIELAANSDVWQRVTGVSISAEGLTFFTDGTSSWRFTHREGCPRWRVDHGRAKHGGGM